MFNAMTHVAFELLNIVQADTCQFSKHTDISDYVSDSDYPMSSSVLHSFHSVLQVVYAFGKILLNLTYFSVLHTKT